MHFTRRMHLTSETVDLYAAGHRSPSAAEHLDSCAMCRRRLRRIEDGRAYFVQHVLPRSFKTVEKNRLWDWLQLRSITQGIRTAVAYDARR